jgi:hypothetical protein
MQLKRDGFRSSRHWLSDGSARIGSSSTCGKLWAILALATATRRQAIAIRMRMRSLRSATPAGGGTKTTESIDQRPPRLAGVRAEAYAPADASGMAVAAWVCW